MFRCLGPRVMTLTLNSDEGFELVIPLSTHNSILYRAHLSKPKSDLQQKCTQLLTPFSGKVFHGLSHSVIHFARSVSFEDQFNRKF